METSRWLRLWLMVTFALIEGTYSTPALSGGMNDASYTYPVGDPRRCIQQAKQAGMSVIPFGVLPGAGWDNLRNVEMGLVVKFNFSQCKVTDDARFLVPDNVVALPIKSSMVETFAEIIDNYLNTTSTTSSSINVQAGLSLAHLAASGSYSSDHQLIKSKQIEDDAVTTRVQIRYHRYEARLDPLPALTTEFKNRILDIAGHLLLNKTEEAYYLGPMVIRDYGTHVQTSVVAGAGLEKIDFLQKKYIGTSQQDKTDMVAEASASFFSVFKVSSTYKHSTSSSASTKYNQSMTHSYINTHGGGIMGANTSLDVWAQGVDANLVAMDRSGDPLDFLINEKLFPELTLPNLVQVKKVIRHSIELYYQMNTHAGCTQMSSPNFSPGANFDDGTCKSIATNFTFGGIYQTCSVSGRYLHNNPCSSMTQLNPITGDYSCPGGYQPVKIFTASKTTAESQNSCHRCWVFAHCCHTDQYQATATYTTYWCAAIGRVAQDSGYMFGGLYTSQKDNDVTGAMSCPKSFYPLRVLSDLVVCVSDEYGSVEGLPFAGFFSCDEGNPLSGIIASELSPAAKVKATGHSLRSFMMASQGEQSESSKWPKKCPEGYSQHMAAVEQGCSIHYCLKSGSLNGPVLPPIKRPPFSSQPAALVKSEDNLVMFQLDKQTWYRDQDAESALKDVTPSDLVASHKSNNGNDGLSPGAAAGIAVGGTISLVAIAAVVVLAIYVAKQRRERRRSAYHRISSQETNEQQSLTTA